MTDQASVLARIIADTRAAQGIVIPWSELKLCFRGKDYEQQWARMVQWARDNNLALATVGTAHPASEVRFWATPRTAGHP
jgi:hypothetical protein